jgi:hypothetical protein
MFQVTSGDWSSDVCSSDLARIYAHGPNDTSETGPSGFIYKVQPVGAKRHDQEVKHGIRGISYHFKEAIVLSKHHPDTMEEIKE